MPYIGAGIQRFNTADSLTVNGDAEVTGTVNPSGDTASGDAAAVGFTSTEGLILTGQGSTSDITLKNDADAVVFSVPTGTDDILFPDNAKAIFGAGSDLELSHNGINSIIEGKTGDLILRTAGTESIFLQDAGGNNLAQFNDNSDVKLYHNANEKLATTSSGVNITGTAVTDGLTSECAAGDSNLALTAYHPTSTSARTIAKFQSNVGGTQEDKVTILCDGKVGIDNGTPAQLLSVGGASSGTKVIQVTNSTAGTAFNNGMQMFINDDSGGLNMRENYPMRFFLNGSERMRIASDGKVAIGTSTAVGTLTTECTAGDSNFALTAYHPTSTSSRNIAKFQSNVGSTQADVVTIGCDGGIEAIGEITATGGALSQNSNGIRTVIGNDGGSSTFGTSTNHQVKFFTNNNHVATLDTSGRLLVRKTSSGLATSGLEVNFTADNGFLGVTSTGTAAHINRQFSDGALITFRHDNTQEGSISVSGTTVSYNGGHLSRWSRLPDDSKDTNIVKGTVMTNLDKMVVWHHEAKEATLYEDGDEIPEGKKVGDEKTPAAEAYDEDNEQLNCMAVSSVEGDINVAGVFVNWDEDDNYNDMNVAMTGDMVIRIAKDTTVARGDLLMSAGDGTAKPQDDDIVRSKTIAKVTSITVSHTYDDGSYLVPCVLMAC